MHAFDTKRATATLKGITYAPFLAFGFIALFTSSFCDSKHELMGMLAFIALLTWLFVFLGVNAVPASLGFVKSECKKTYGAGYVFCIVDRVQVLDEGAGGF